MEDQHSDDPDPLNLSFRTQSESDLDSNKRLTLPSQALNPSIDASHCASDGAKAARRSKKGGRKHRRASVLAEGQRGEKVESYTGEVSCKRRLPRSGCTKQEIGLAEVNSESSNAMERTISYSSDEEFYEESIVSSDTDGDHTDSSDDDDPKSQVDRLIEEGTLRYMDGENSALSSEDESDDSSEYDSESDITDVSPLISAAGSPIGLSPVLPRRTVPTSPLALHDNRDLYLHKQSPFNWDVSKDSQHEETLTENIYDNHESDSRDSTNMKLLLQAVIELENHNSRRKSKMNKNGLPRTSSQEHVFIHPIRDNPHHTHLNKSSIKRKNMSFSNEEVQKFDRENKILLKKLLSEQNRHHSVSSLHHRYHKPSNSSVNRKRDDEKIRRENLLLLRKIQEAKPSKEVMERTGAPHSVSLKSSSSLRSQTASCGASIRNLSQPSVQTPRKETAL